jgi:cytochrome c-type biogenesis protein CcmF
MTIAAAVAITMNPWLLMCVAITALGTFAVIVDFARSWSARWRSTRENVVVCAARLIDKDHRRYGGQLVHLGIMTIVIGVAGSALFSTESVHQLKPGESVAVGRYSLALISLDEERDANFTAVDACVKLTDSAGNSLILHPQRRFYDAWLEQPSSEVAILSNWRQDVYLSLAGWDEGGKVVALQLKINPLVLWIWIGGMVMAAGCLFCLVPPLLPYARRGLATAAEPNVQPTQPGVALPALQTESYA